MIPLIYRSQELENFVSSLQLENEQLKKALLEMKDAAEEWKALAEALVRCNKQINTIADLALVKDYYESLRGTESKPS